MAISRRAALAVSGLTAVAGTLTALLMAQLATGIAAAATATDGCQATAHVENQWGSGPTGGEVVSVKVVNTAAKTATAWSVTWALPSSRRIVSGWNATVTTSSSGTATAVNVPWNGRLAPGASATFGMQLAGTGPALAMSCANDAAPPTTSPPVSSSASSPPPVRGDVDVTEADSRSTVTLVVGQTLGVTLSAEFRPIPPPTNPPLRLDSGMDGYPSGKPLRQLFRAIATGSVDLSTQTDDPCFSTTPPCAKPVRLWTLHVNVVNPTSDGQTVTVSDTDNNKAVSLRVGDTLVVSLSHIYPAPTLTPTGVLVPISVTGGYPELTPVNAQYRVAVTGQVNLATLSDSACNHAPMPCPSPQVWWRLQVTVTG